MKTLFYLLILSFIQPVFADDDLRDLEQYPLSSKEWTAYRMAKGLAKQHGVLISPRCVNASLEPYETPVTVQFFYKGTGDEPDQCGNPHYSIEVEFDSNGKVISIILVDA